LLESTRDTIEDELVVEELVLEFIDTAEIRETIDVVETSERLKKLNKLR
jgi:tRNA U34 5-carboxymethylaminomethyl modifying GTPase MnmE/TrmE